MSQATFNAHCHLELTPLRGAIRPGLSFPEWVAELLEKWSRLTPEALEAGAAEGVAELRANGTTAVLDISARDSAVPALVKARKEGFLSLSFRELLSPDPKRAALLVEFWRERMLQMPAVMEGLSPHAPYSISGDLAEFALHEAKQRGLWLCVHAAEFPEEVEMLVTGRGALRDFLAPMLPPNWKAPGARPIPYLDRLGLLGPKTLLAHCNEITEYEARLIAESGARVVVCPGTHVYFQRGRFPLPMLLEAGVTCYLGTDSLASNEVLSMEREISLAVDLCEGKVSREQLEQLASIDRAADFFGATGDLTSSLADHGTANAD